MKNILKPYWLLIGVSLPQLLIFIIMGRIFYIINSQLTEENLRLWAVFGGLLGLSYISYTVYGVIRLISRKEVHLKTGVSLFLTYIPYLYFFTVFNDKIIPSSIPDWMLFEISPEMMVVTMITPSMVVAMLISVVWLTPFKFGILFNKKTVPVLAIPAFWFLLVTALLPLLHVPFTSVLDHLSTISFVIGTVAFLFVIVKLIYHLLNKKPQIWQKAVIPIVTLGPLFGLSINNQGNIFGNFSSVYFYLLAVFTGVLLVIPSSDNKYLRSLLFILKSITFTFTAYFFIIFLPYLPFSLIGLLAFGLGILLLVPVAQAFVHVRSLWDDYKFLQQHYKKAALLIVFICGVSVIPALISISFNSDKGHIDKALNFIYQQNLSDKNEVKVNTNALSRSLNFLRENKSSGRRGGFFSSNYKIPLISAYYNWLVLENLTLSEQKIKAIKSIFLGVKYENNTINNTFNNTIETSEEQVQPVRIDKHTVETQFDSKNNCYRSWIHFDLKNSNDFNAEFRARFELPQDSFITNYYLYVNNKKKFGMIADKRAANWIYDQIVTIRRDPGILSYISDSIIEFKVFPFNTNETRKTGFEIIHKTPVTLKIGELGIDLGNTNVEGSTKEVGLLDASVKKIDDDVTLVPYEVKKALLKVTRAPFYHFVIDRSEGSKDRGQELVKCVENYIEKNKLNHKDIGISALNYNLKKLTAGGAWQEQYYKLPAVGGLYLDHALKSIHFENYKDKSHKYPAVIIVTDDIDKATLIGSYDSLKYLMPDVKCFYSLNTEGMLLSHSLDGKGTTEIPATASISPDTVLPWPDVSDIKAYLSDDTSTSIVLGDSDYELNSDKAMSSLDTGFVLKAATASMFLHPEKTSGKTLEIVKASIKTGVMSPLTSYIVLENEAQEKVLLEKQQKILSTKKPLDVGEPSQMSEPSLMIIALITAAFVLVVRHRRRKMAV
ncbi:MAG TPA: MSEP-CTERM sorting domain-containing protein [Pseudobacteroides sp.]|uniref:MSEP-CTERM sorting domain-containing protein n=1 Tax=Pseudobacteroides sp. TaxID=1968840 RepID=UPI002F935BD7